MRQSMRVGRATSATSRTQKPRNRKTAEARRARRFQFVVLLCVLRVSAVEIAAWEFVRPQILPWNGRLFRIVIERASAHNKSQAGAMGTDAPYSLSLPLRGYRIPLELGYGCFLTALSPTALFALTSAQHRTRTASRGRHGKLGW